MSPASSTLGALAVLSIILAATAGTESDVTRLPKLSVTSPSSVTEPADGSRPRLDEAVSAETTPAPRRNETRNRTADDEASRSSGDPEITGAASAIPASTSLPISDQTISSVKAKASSQPRPERLVAPPTLNATDNSPENFAANAADQQAPRDNEEVPMNDLGNEEVATVRLESTTVRAPVKATTPTSSALPGKSVKTRNDLVGGNFHEIKSAQKVNSLNPFGGKVVKPNIASALGKYAPYFEDGQEELNVTARIGSTVILDCEIGMLGNKTVTWSYHSADVIRLLTVGRNAYSVDQRISLYFRYPTNWRLRIQYATPRDSGLYECQVATYPPLVKKIHLLVTAPELAIMDDSGRIKSGERHLKAGSALRLRCEARDIPERYNESVIWTRGDEILSEDVSENRTTEYVDGREIQVVVSTLVVEKATPRHAGNYSCVVPEKAKTTVAVHVLNGELPAAVHDGNGVSRSVLNLWLIHLTVSYVFSR